MKNHQTDNISSLIVKYVVGKIADNELQELSAWRNETENNEKLFQELCNKDILKKRLENYRIVDEAKAYEAIKRKIGTKSVAHRFINWRAASSIAAVFVGVLLVVSYLFYGDIMRNTGEVANHTIEAGKRGAELVLSDGRIVPLGNGMEAFYEKDGTQINTDSNSIEYTHSTETSLENVYNEVRVGHGEEFELMLADGTKVWLNSMSSIKFPVQFSGKERGVEVTGEVYFEVEHDIVKPFIVHTPIHDIRVLGTSFNVSCYTNEEQVHTTLVEGKIQVDNIVGKDEEVFVTPGQQFVFNKVDKTLIVQEVNASSYISWTKGFFQFEKQSLDELFIELARWYPIEVKYSSEEVKRLQFTGKLPRFENVETVLGLIEKISDVQFEIIKNKIIVR